MIFGYISYIIIKALLAVVLCAAMLVAAASPAFAAVDNNDVLRFNKDGKFKIMQISDTQDIDIPREAMIMFMEKALDAEKPDLVVFTGDQLAGGAITELLALGLELGASHMTQYPRCTALARTTCLSMPPRAARRSSTSG